MARQQFRRRKFCRFTAEGITEIDYKDINIRQQDAGESGELVRIFLDAVAHEHQGVDLAAPGLHQRVLEHSTDLREPGGAVNAGHALQEGIRLRIPGRSKIGRAHV